MSRWLRDGRSFATHRATALPRKIDGPRNAACAKERGAHVNQANYVDLKIEHSNNLVMKANARCLSLTGDGSEKCSRATRTQQKR